MALRPPVPSRMARSYLSKMAIAQMTSTITVSRPADPAFNTTTGEISTGTYVTIWTGPARIYSESGALSVIGDEMVSVGTTYIAIAQSAPLPRVDDIAKVNTTLDDPALVDTVFRIVDVSVGGLLSPTRRLTVTTIESNPWMS